MFLNTVILVLQEILEAALLVSVLLGLSRLLTQNTKEGLQINMSWLPLAILTGLGGAWLYASVTPIVSEWFDYVGLEVLNASMQVAILCALAMFCFMFTDKNRNTSARMLSRLAPILMCIIVSLGVIREVSEIILYLNGVLGDPANMSPIVLGTLVAAGIGVSSGIVLYLIIISLPVLWSYRICLLLLALFAGNMASQATLLLTQADWLPYTVQLWDTSGVIPEFSVIGQLLYALVGYEANPSLLQAGLYLGSALLIAFSPLFLLAWKRNKQE